MYLEDKLIKDFAEWARTNTCGYGEDEADIWFEDIPHYDSLEWKVRLLIREAMEKLKIELEAEKMSRGIDNTNN